MAHDLARRPRPRTLRMANIRSCLRRVEAPSTPSSSAMRDQLGRGLFLQVFEMHCEFSSGEADSGRGRSEVDGESGLSTRADGGLTTDVARYAAAVRFKSSEPSDGPIRPAQNGLTITRTTISADGDARHLVHQPQRLAADRPLARARASCRSRPSSRDSRTSATPARTWRGTSPGSRRSVIAGERQAEHPDQDHRRGEDDLAQLALALDPLRLLVASPARAS